MSDVVTTDALSQLLTQVIAIARDAGDKIMAIYEAEAIGVQFKHDSSPLTAADLASQNVISQGLEKLRQGWPVLSEELAEIPFERRRDWRLFWLVDPLDGTKEFISRNGEFTVNIALVEDGQPILGVVYAPAIGRLYHAARGCGAYLTRDGKTTGIAASKFEAGKIRVVASRSHRGEKTDAFLEQLGEYEVVSMGSSLKFCLLADGSADLYPRLAPTMEWDTAAAQCIVEEAGGLVTDLSGIRLVYNKPNLHNPEFIASGNRLRQV